MIKINPQVVEQVQSNRNLSDQIFYAINDSILSGDIKPGDQLRQEELSRLFHTSSRTIRETLKRLVAEGLATHTPHKGVKVVEFDMDTQEELCAIRASLEVLALEYAFDNLTEEDLQRMREILPLTGSCCQSISIQKMREYNREFHWIIIRASKKPYLMRMLDQIWKLIFTYYKEHEFDQDLLEQNRLHDLAVHEQILEALEKKDLPKARELLIYEMKEFSHWLKEQMAA